MPSNVDKLKILGKMYHLSLLVCGYVEKFNRAYKFTLGDRLERARHRAGREHGEDLQSLKTNLL